ncbi:MAG: bifunctional hydroxymethylpyrimidine kinase/phosphomethylpyrimidine kinase [Promethearchaeota archaeon]
MNPTCLTIAGADPTCGAGIQADVRTFDKCGVHPFSAITAITFQTATNFFGFISLSNVLKKQIDSIVNHYPVKVIKVGMIPDLEALKIISDTIDSNEMIVVLDPVSISSAGKRLSSEGMEDHIKTELFPRVQIITPNVNEASYYSGIDLTNLRINDIEKARSAGKIILKQMFKTSNKDLSTKAVILKGIASDNDNILDLACFGKFEQENIKFEFKLYQKRKFHLKQNVHGTGCVFSSAIAAYLAKENDIESSIDLAEKFFDYKFQNHVIFSNGGRSIDLTFSEEELNVINQIKEIYNYITSSKKFSVLIPEVRMNISGSLSHATNKNQIAGFDGRITIINGFPHACGDIKFGASEHTARLLLEAKKFDPSINFVMNLKYDSEWINKIRKNSNLEMIELKREQQPQDIKNMEKSTMQWLIQESVSKKGKVPDIIWDSGSKGKEPMIRLFAKDSKKMIKKLDEIIKAIQL